MTNNYYQKHKKAWKRSTQRYQSVSEEEKHKK